jgi:hypothetical protein
MVELPWGDDAAFRAKRMGSSSADSPSEVSSDDAAAAPRTTEGTSRGTGLVSPVDIGSIDTVIVDGTVCTVVVVVVVVVGEASS